MNITSVRALLWIVMALGLATFIAFIAIIKFSTEVNAGVTCTTYGGKGPGGHRWSQTTCR